MGIIDQGWGERQRGIYPVRQYVIGGSKHSCGRSLCSESQIRLTPLNYIVAQNSSLGQNIYMWEGPASATDYTSSNIPLAPEHRIEGKPLTVTSPVTVLIRSEMGCWQLLDSIKRYNRRSLLSSPMGVPTAANYRSIFYVLKLHNTLSVRNGDRTSLTRLSCLNQATTNPLRFGRNQ